MNDNLTWKIKIICSLEVPMNLSPTSIIFISFNSLPIYFSDVSKQRLWLRNTPVPSKNDQYAETGANYFVSYKLQYLR